jgi:preprotein translocase SecE subunit
MFNFLKDVIEELKKLTVPSKKETYITTATIIVSVIVVSLGILIVDLIISKLMGLIF